MGIPNLSVPIIKAMPHKKKNRSLMSFSDSVFATLSSTGIQDFLKSSYKSKFVRNVAIVASGTAASQVIAIAFSPIITRLYEPEAFGILGTFLAIASILTPIAALSYPTAIVLQKKDIEAKAIARLSTYITISIASIFAVLLFSAGDWLAVLFRIEQITAFLWLLPLMILFSGFVEISSQSLIRRQKFAVTATSAVIHTLVVNLLNTSIGIFRPFASMLVYTTAIGNGIYAALLTIRDARLNNKPNSTEKNILGLRNLRDLAKSYYDFPCFRTPQIIINSFSQNLPLLMLAALFGPTIAGLYALCKRLLDVPIQLIGKSVGDVFYPKLAEAASSGINLTHLIKRATLLLALAGLIPFSLIVILGPNLFSFFFGTNWAISGEYARWLTPWIFVGFINRPSFSAIPILKLQKAAFIYEILLTLSRSIALYIGFAIYKDSLISLQLMSLVGFSFNAFMILYIVKKSGEALNRSH